MWLSKDYYIHSFKRHSFYFLLRSSFAFLILVLNGETGEGKEREKRKGHEWWMLCVCLSFPITELCLLKRRSDAFLISAFLTDEEQALTGGTVCFKHRLTSHSVFTSDTIHCSSHSCSAALFHYNFLDLYSFSCSVIKCIVSLRSGLLWCDAKEKWDYISCFFKEAFKATKIHRREQTLWREAALWYWAVQMHTIPTVGTSSIHIKIQPVSVKLISIMAINS